MDGLPRDRESLKAGTGAAPAAQTGPCHRTSSQMSITDFCRYKGVSSVPHLECSSPNSPPLLILQVLIHASVNRTLHTASRENRSVCATCVTLIQPPASHQLSCAVFPSSFSCSQYRDAAPCFSGTRALQNCNLPRYSQVIVHPLHALSPTVNVPARMEHYNEQLE